MPLPAYPDEASIYTTAVANKGTTAPPQSSPEIVDAPPAKPVERDPRRLGPAKSPEPRDFAGRASSPSSASRLPKFGLPIESLYTMGTGLAIVTGLFLLTAWTWRRGAQKANRALPEGVVAVLGRVPLSSRQVAELVRIGNKLVLLSVTPHGAEPLTEITDPAEIDRLVGLCKQHDPKSTTAEFEDIFRQFADEPTPDGFLGQETMRIEAREAAADAYAAFRGGAARA